ncbi:MAG: hypothetical protein CFE44_11425 [Burkholderiales bacterium PBB4]|nr:MAG: hypothetical protein CFE44_11425 [Burkholderiales bacterium PBB4]
MNPKKTQAAPKQTQTQPPTSKPASPAAAVIATGSRSQEGQHQLDKSNGKSKGTSKSQKAAKSPTPAEPEIATVHECAGTALVILPSSLRAILGDKDLHSNALEMETKEVLLIVREAGVVVYVHLPIIVKELKAPSTGIEHGGVLMDITGSPPNGRSMRGPGNAAKGSGGAAMPKASRRSSDAR